MSPEAAWTVHLSILAAGVVAWLIAARFHASSFRLPDPGRPGLLAADEAGLDRPPDEVRERILDALRSSGGAVAIERADEGEIAGRISVMSGRSSMRPVPFAIALAPDGGGTRAGWAIRRDPERADGLRLASLLFLVVLGPGAMLAAGGLVQTLAIPSDDPESRTLAWQTIQIVHFLWPPFLFAGLRRLTVKNARRAIGNVVRNTAF